jgi:uncharacterized protein (DUF2252 family)
MSTRHQSIEERIAAGRALRKTVPRSSHKATGSVDRDPVTLLEASSKGRVARLVPLRYGRMLTSPLAFYRGSAIIQAHDLAGTPHTGIVQQICGDAHLMNFGSYATPERNQIFDLDDFDETHPGPWEWDLKRLVASVTIAARDLGFKSSLADEAVRNAVNGYARNMARHAEQGALELWYDRITLQDLYDETKSAAGKKRVTRFAEKAQRRIHDMLLPKMGAKVDGRWQLHDAPPALFHIHGNSTLFDAEDDWMQLERWQKLSAKLYGDYLQTLSASHRHLLGAFAQQDMAFKVVGVGSVGTRCLILLMTDAKDKPLFLQLKEASKSVLAPYVPKAKSAYTHEGQRVVAGQRLMQAASDIFLGWAVGPFGRHFYVRQLRDMKISPEIENLDGPMLSGYAWLCGRMLARAHARAGGFAPEISGYIGSGQQFGKALVAYARDYADQVERDFATFRDACRSGRLTAQSEADFCADLAV